MHRNVQEKCSVSRIEERGGLLEQHFLQHQESKCDKRAICVESSSFAGIRHSVGKRKLRAMSGRERRLVFLKNHRISKTIVNTEFAVFALEDLGQIGKNRFTDKRMRNRLNIWAHFQLETFIRFKTEGLVKTVVKIDPTMTLQMCSNCGWIDRENRHGSEFHCIRCGFSLHADLNASRYIAHLRRSEAGRLSANQPKAMGDDGDHSGAQSKS
jgi:transposase